MSKEEKSDELAPQLKRRQFCFELIIKGYEVVNEQLRFLYRLLLALPEKLGFQYSKEVFSHGVCIQRRRSCQSQICSAFTNITLQTFQEIDNRSSNHTLSPNLVVKRVLNCCYIRG